MQLKDCLNQVRQRCPLIHCITNYVTVNDVANALLACGGSPIMADEEAEVVEITTICGGLDLNIGTLNRRTISSMLLAGKTAQSLGHPVLLDPVGAGASQLRTNTALTILREVQPDVVRGNISEIKTLAQGTGTTKGVDADNADVVTAENLDQSVAFVKKFAQRTGSVIAVTGAIDLVSDGTRCFVIHNGRAEMGKITGTGCQLSAVLTAYLVANPGFPLEAAAAAVCMMGVAGEIAWRGLQPGEGNASYRDRILDAIFGMNGDTLEAEARYEIR